ncbi:MAG: HAD-IIA family hydrolase [Candidatus Eremiobacterota bacterium]
MINNIKAIAFDLDGTIYYGNRLVEGVLDLFKYLKEKNIKTFYFTNNSRKSRKEIYEKLSHMGFELTVHDIYSSTGATALYLGEHNIKHVYCLGSGGLVEELIAHHINISDDPEKVQALVIGLHHDFDYAGLAKAINIVIKSNCKIIACNRDRTYPVEDNKLMPGCGAIVASVEEALNRKIDFLAGKPGTYMIELLAKDWNLQKNEIMIVGDSVETDIEMARRYGCPSVLIAPEKFFNCAHTTVLENILLIKEFFR